MPFASPPPVAPPNATRLAAVCFSSSSFGRLDSALPLYPAMWPDYRACFS